MNKYKIINKGYEIKESMGSPSPEDFEIIKEYVSKDTKPEDVFVYKLKLCDNEVDRDLEQFSNNCLVDIASLFKGKVGVYDHEWKSGNIHSRIYKAYPVIVEDKTNSQNQPYSYVEAYAYTTKDNEDLINQIKKGLKKEVSIGISGSRPVCSICGKEECEHQKGLYYNDKLCYSIIKSAEDAYEFSFVAVNAQKQAGVEKSYKGGQIMDIRKSLLEMANTYPSQANEVLKAFEELQKPENERIEVLENENSKLKAKLKEYTDKEEAERKEEYLKAVMGDLQYKNEKAEGFGNGVIAENEGMEADALHNLLTSEYGFLFETVENPEEVVEELVEDVKETEEEVHEEVHEENVEETEEIEKEEEKEEEKTDDENEKLKEIVEKKLNALKKGKLNIEGFTSNLTREPKNKAKVQSGIKFN